MGTRGVSPVVGYALLLGLTLLVGLSLFVIGGGVLGDYSASAEREQAETSMTQLADAAEAGGTGEASGSEFAFAAADRGATWSNESAGRVEIVVVNGTDRTTVVNSSLGAYRHRTGHGVEIGYQSGGVFRREDGHVEVVRSPAFEYRDSDEPTLHFPIVRVNGSTADGGAFDGELSVAEREEHTVDVDNPLTGDHAYVDVRSRYCTGWETYVRERTDGLVGERCEEAGETGSSELRVNLSVADEYVNTTTDTGEKKIEGNETRETLNGTYGLYAEDELILDRTGGTINASVGAGDEVEFTGRTGYDHRGEVVENVSNEREPHDETIQSLLDRTNASDAAPLCTHDVTTESRGCYYDAGTYRVSDFNGGGGHNVTLDVSEGNVTFVVPGDLWTAGYTNWNVVGHEDGGAARVFVDGDMQFFNVEMGPEPGPALADRDDPISTAPEHVNAEALQFLGSSDTQIGVESAFIVEAKISAPTGDGEGGSHLTLGGRDASVQFAGALHAGTVEISSSSTDIYQDSDAATREYVRTGGENRTRTIEETNTTRKHPDTQLYYLHVSETELELDD